MGDTVLKLHAQKHLAGRHVEENQTLRGPTLSSPTGCMNTTVFVVDDDASVRKSLCRLLDSLGFSTETFASAEEFLKREQYQGIGCIILDVHMLGLDGLELQDELAKADYSVPIVFITGHASISAGVQAMRKGAIDFLPKPFDDEQLLNAVRSALDKDRHANAERAEARDILRRMEQLTPRKCKTFRWPVRAKNKRRITK